MQSTRGPKKLVYFYVYLRDSDIFIICIALVLGRLKRKGQMADT